MKLSDIRRLSGHFAGTQPDPQQMLQLLKELGLDPKHLYQELEMSSRFVDTHRDSSWSNEQISLHSHSFYEILHCANSCGAEYLVGADRYRLQKDDIIIVPPGVSHRPLLPPAMAEPYQREVLWLSPELIQILSHLFQNADLYRISGTRLLRTAGTKWEFLGELFRSGVREAERQQMGWETVVLGNTLQLIIYLRRAMLEQSAPPLSVEDPELLDQVLAYMEEHLSEKITLSDAAHHFFVSESTITHSFHNKMGVSFHRCLTQRRLIAAKTLIQQNQRLESIGEQVGFADYSSFYRAFKKEFGISPRQYRQLLSADSAYPLP